jgi:hypothetical protein
VKSPCASSIVLTGSSFIFRSISVGVKLVFISKLSNNIEHSEYSDETTKNPIDFNFLGIYGSSGSNKSEKFNE